MLLTLTTTSEPATDLGFLLHKHPDRHQVFSLPFGTAYIFYPEATTARCTAALVVDIDPIDLVRGRQGTGADGLLDQYVNDRPYAASSFLSVALRRVFGSALSGRCDARPDLVTRGLALTARVTPLRCRDGIEAVRNLFEPLGYAVGAERVVAGPYWDVTVAAEARIADLLSHLYVLIPVLDDQKHYWVAADEIDKLLRHGEGWLPVHPAREMITHRYLKHQGRLTRMALARLEAADESKTEDEATETTEEARPQLRLHDERLDRVATELDVSGATSVLGLGCGSGKLLAMLVRNRRFSRVVGLDVSVRQLEITAERLRLREFGGAQWERIALLHGSLTYRDRRLAGFDAAAIVEVLEHIDPPRLGAFADAVFGGAHPRTVVLTTPNAEYNARYEALAAGELRHADHRFEWSRAEFRAWAEGVAQRFGYAVRLDGIGEMDADLGAPSQLAIFTC